MCSCISSHVEETALVMVMRMLGKPYKISLLMACPSMCRKPHDLQRLRQWRQHYKQGQKLPKAKPLDKFRCISELDRFQKKRRKSISFLSSLKGASWSRCQQTGVLYIVFVCQDVCHKKNKECVCFFWFVLDKLVEPLETINVSRSTHHTAHEELKWTNTVRHIAIGTCGEIMESKFLFQDVATHGTITINLVAENHKWHGLQSIVGQEVREFTSRFTETRRIRGIHNVNDAIHVGEIVLPKTSSSFVTAHVERFETHIAHLDLFTLGMACGLVSDHLQSVMAMVIRIVVIATVKENKQGESIMIGGIGVNLGLDHPSSVCVCVCVCEPCCPSTCG